VKRLFYLIVISLILLCSCEDTYNIKLPEAEYEFKIEGRTYQDDNGYYHLNINSTENQQTLHRFGAFVTNKDKWGLPTQVIWRCDAFWYITDTINVNILNQDESPWNWDNYTVTGFEGMSVPIVNGTSYADPIIDSVYCMMAPIGAMIGDTVSIFGQAWFEEGDIIIHDSFQIIFE
tara:strand:+ start:1192 stop:1719 length:528 start_codon:yes stop_codon:yes gene_type:complete